MSRNKKKNPDQNCLNLGLDVLRPYSRQAKEISKAGKTTKKNVNSQYASQYEI